ncbi:unnamed protein product [Amoebophrya sp. A25]|nr:unnamed protein product [Amoebophrya sp. A25]|eukprot:GSA25T00014384001.1
MPLASPSKETDAIIKRQLWVSVPAAAGANQEADAVINKRMSRLAGGKRTRNLGEQKPLLRAIETWGTWLDVNTNVAVARSRSVPRPASARGLVLEKHDIFAGWDASLFPRKRKGRRFKGSFMSLDKRKPIYSTGKVPPHIGPGQYEVQSLGVIDPRRAREPLSKFRLASSAGFSVDERWKSETATSDWRPGPGAYGVPYVSLFPDPETETRSYQTRGTVFGSPSPATRTNGRKTRFGRTEPLDAVQGSRTKILNLEEEFS